MRMNRIGILAMLLLAGVSPSRGEQPLAVVSGPDLLPVPAVPLARVLEVQTTVPSRVHVSVTDGVHGWKRWLGGTFSRIHREPLLGFKPGTTYDVRVRVESARGQGLDVPGSLSFTTDPLPANFPPMEVLTSKPGKMEPGFIIIAPLNTRTREGFTIILDAAGEVVWYIQRGGSDIRQLDNGALLFIPGDQTQIVEMSLLGEELRVWHAALSQDPPPPGSIPVQVPTFHHEVFPTSYGTLLTIHRNYQLIDGYPTSDTDPNAPLVQTMVMDEPVIEFDPATGQILNEWSPMAVLDPTRIGYDAVDPVNDWAHVNAIIHDERDDSLIFSLRHQDAVYKADKQSGELIWILGNHDNWGPDWQPFLLDPVGPRFEWPYHQHAPMVTPHGTLLVYDNGNYRVSPFAPKPPLEQSYSRAVEFDIDPDRMEIRQVWEYGVDFGYQLFSFAVGDVDWLPRTGNLLINNGAVIVRDGAITPSTETLILEVDHASPPDELFALSIRDPDPNAANYLNYRVEKIRDLYADLDGDGFTREEDCDDDRAEVSPLGLDLPGDALDQDCSGRAACDACGTWPSHGRFVSCVARAVSVLYEAGTIGLRERADLLRAAARSRVGTRNFRPAQCPGAPGSGEPESRVRRAIRDGVNRGGIGGWRIRP